MNLHTMRNNENCHIAIIYNGLAMSNCQMRYRLYLYKADATLAVISMNIDASTLKKARMGYAPDTSFGRLVSLY